MASYTDIVPQFREYVPQLPVEAMVKVGMEKQRRYDEGVQKIQSYIDNVAGLDIYRPIDKQYTQSKLNELGNNLRTIAAGDFSNAQLVNSVGGMTKQIIRDPNIQAAVGSTAMYRKEKLLQDAARKEGKNGPSNDWLFNTQTSEWLNDPNVGASFNGKYKQYVNWKKNATEIVKSLTGDSTITDDAFTTDSAGNLVIADAIVRKQFKGISPEKIQQALLVGLSPADFEQISIDGRYNYSNVTNEKFAEDISKSYTTDIDFYKNQRTVFENAKNSTNSAVEIKSLNEKISALDKIIKKTEDDYSSIKDVLSLGDYESAKARYYTVKQLTNFSKAFSNTETSLTYENSPLADMKMRREVKDMDWKKFTLDYDQRERFHKEDKEEKAIDRALKKEELRLKKLELEGYGGLPGPIDQSLLPKLNAPTVTEGVNQIDKLLTTEENTFLTRKGKDKAWLDQQRVAYEKSRNGVDPEVKEYFDRVIPIERKNNADRDVLITAQREADQKFGTVYDLIPKDAKSLTLTTPTASYTYTPKDLIDFNTILQRYVKSTSSTTYGTGTSGMAAPVSMVYNDDKARLELSPKMFRLYEMYKKKQEPRVYGELSGGETSVMNTVQWYKQNVLTPYAKKFNDIRNFIDERVTEKLTVAQGVAYGIPTANDVQKSTISTALIGFADIADKQKGMLAGSPNWNSETARALAAEGTTRYNLTIVEGTERQPRMYRMSVSGKAGNIEFNVTPEQKDAVFGSMFEASPAARAIRPYQEQINKKDGYSTAPEMGQSTSWSNAFMTNIDFPNINYYGIKANLTTPDRGKTYSIRLSVYDPISQTYINDIPYMGMLNEEQVAPAMVGLTDAALFSMLNEKPPTANDMKMLKNSSKKPL